MKMIGMMVLTAALCSGSITQQTYLTDGKGRLADRKKGTLIALNWEEKKLENGLKMFYGKAEWTAEAGAEGQNAEVPVAVYWVDKDRQSLKPLGTYNTEADGKFWIIVPDDGRVYRIGAHPEKARNMPDKARELIEKSKEKKGETKE